MPPGHRVLSSENNKYRDIVLPAETVPVLIFHGGSMISPNG